MLTFTQHAYNKINGDADLAVAVMGAANSPTVAYESNRHPGQWKHIRGEWCAVVDPRAGKVITFFRNVVETDIRADQADDPDAVRFQAKRDRAQRDAKRAARRERDRALTSALKGGNKR